MLTFSPSLKPRAQFKVITSIRPLSLEANNSTSVGLDVCMSRIETELGMKFQVRKHIHSTVAGVG